MKMPSLGFISRLKALYLYDKLMFNANYNQCVVFDINLGISAITVKNLYHHRACICLLESTGAKRILQLLFEHRSIRGATFF